MIEQSDRFRALHCSLTVDNKQFPLDRIVISVLLVDEGGALGVEYAAGADRVFLWDASGVGARTDYNGVLLLHTALQRPLPSSQPDKIIRIELVLSEVCTTAITLMNSLILYLFFVITRFYFSSSTPNSGFVKIRFTCPSFTFSPCFSDKNGHYRGFIILLLTTHMFVIIKACLKYRLEITVNL